MGYLVCDKCEGHYELQPGERIGDFDKCQCGGELRWVAKIDDFTKKESIKAETQLKDNLSLENSVPPIKLTRERKILGYGILAITFLAIIFKNFDSSSLIILPTFLLVLAVPFYVSFKIPNKAYKYAIILAVWYAFIYTFLTIFNLGGRLLVSLAWDNFSSDLIFILILYLVSSWLGKTANKLRE